MSGAMSIPSRVTRWPVLIRHGRPGAVAALYLRFHDGKPAWTPIRPRAARFYAPEEVSDATRLLPQGITWHTEEDTADAS